MIQTAVLLPATLLLLPEVTGGEVGEVEQLRVACHNALWSLLARVPDRLVLVAPARPGEPTGVLDMTWESPTAHVRPWPAVADETAAGHRAPLALEVGRSVLRAAGIEMTRVQQVAVAVDADPAACADLGRSLAGADDERVAIVVVGDGTSCRRPGSPVAVDARAIGYDDEVHIALANADVEALRGLDPALAAELRVSGRAPWQILAGAVADGSAPGIREYYAGDPFGVQYFIYSWLAN